METTSQAKSPPEPTSQQGGCCACGSDGCGLGDAAAGEEARFSYYVAGMTCGDEVEALKHHLGPLVGGAENLEFNVSNGRLNVLDAPPALEDGGIRRAVSAAGMTAIPWQGTTARTGRKDAPQGPDWPLLACATSGVLFAAGILLALWDARSFAAFVERGGGAATPLGLANLLLGGAVIAGAWFVAPRAWRSAKRARPDINLLVIIALAGAMVLGELAEAASVAFLFALSLQLEGWSVRRARRAIGQALDLVPHTAWVRADGEAYREVPVEDVSLGTEILVRPGAKVPLDGVIVRGEGSVDESALTGEPLGVPKAPGGRVYAGTLNLEGALEVRVDRPAADSTAARLLRQVEEARGRRAQVEQLVDRFALYYTPAMIVLAAGVALVPPLLLGGVWADWFYRALVLLVIACPCALVISTPISIFAGLACAARAGVLIRGGAFLEQAGRIDAFAFDKTGTLTTGQPRVREVHPVSGSGEDLLALAASLERHSEHPLAHAIVEEAARRGLDVAEPEGFRALPGRGAEGRLGGVTYWAGNERLARERCGGDLAKAEADTGTAVAVGREGALLGWIVLEDELRPEAATALQELRALGVGHLALLTGDRETTAERVASELRLDAYRAGLLPEDKVAAMVELSAGQGATAMVGDGMNDAPALAGAGLSISMAKRGSGLAVETSDVALMRDDLRALPWLLRHGRRTRRTIGVNIGVTLAAKGAFLLLAIAGVATLWMAVAADVGTTVLVSLNALRLLR